jgi:hypothetical protein
MGGEDVTGLHAFDDLDPVSTVSALSAMPEPELAPQAPPRRNPSAGSAPPPPVRGASASPGLAAQLTPPPPRGGLGSTRSVPPPPPAAHPADDVELFDSDVAEDEDSFEDTRVMSQADFEYSETASRGANSDSDLPPASTSQGIEPRAGIDDTELLELSATTVATKIEMDWDEDEVETKLRDEGEDYGAPSAATTPHQPRRSVFPPVTSTSPFPGNPSPFLPIHSSYPPPSIPTPEHDEWEDDEDARTRVMIAPSFPPPPSLPPAMPRVSAYPPPAPAYGTPAYGSTTEVALETPAGHSWIETLKNNKLTWLGFGAVALVATAIVVTALTGSSDTATVTLETKPADAQVIIDGKVLTGQSSPFTLQGLDPSVPHSIEVSKDGFATQKQQFNVSEGEVKPLPGVELAALRVDTGFAIASTPPGATVFVDGNRIGQVTPARVTDLGEGLHVVRLELPGGYQPWETQVALAKGQVIELPNARLVGGGIAQRERPVAAEPREQPSARRESSSASSSHRRSSSSRVASAPRRPAPQQVAVAGGGSQGVLRVNSRPWSQVFVDGRMVGNTPQLNIALAPGKHKIKLVNPQLGMSKNFDVAVQAGKATTKIVDLE